MTPPKPTKFYFGQPSLTQNPKEVPSLDEIKGEFGILRHAGALGEKVAETLNSIEFNDVEKAFLAAVVLGGSGGTAGASVAKLFGKMPLARAGAKVAGTVAKTAAKSLRREAEDLADKVIDRASKFFKSSSSTNTSSERSRSSGQEEAFIASLRDKPLRNYREQLKEAKRDVGTTECITQGYLTVFGAQNQGEKKEMIEMMLQSMDQICTPQG